MPFSKLQAVNKILAAGGGSPVNSLGSGSDSANLAEQSLDNAIRTIQTETQVFNTTKTILIPDVSNKIALDDNVIAVVGRPRDDDDGTISTTSSMTNNGINVGAAGGSTSNASENMRVTIRDGYLYDLKDDTDIFTKSVYVWITREMSYEGSPAHVQNYAIAQAAREYQMEHQGDQVSDAMLRDKEELARQTFNKQETRQAQANHFTRARNTTLLKVGGRYSRQSPSGNIPGANY